MNELQTKLNNVISSLEKSKFRFIIFPLVFVLFFLFLFSTTPPPQKNGQPSPSMFQTNETTPIASSAPIDLYKPEIVWEPKQFSEETLQNINFQKTQLSDGSVKYSYPSSNENRPNELIVKNNTIIYQRSIVSDKYIYNYTNTMDAPDYVFQGSHFYGPNTMVYVYVKDGVAFVADADTTVVREQINFQPLNIEDFKKKYGGDVVDFTIIPTAAGHDQ